MKYIENHCDFTNLWHVLELHILPELVKEVRHRNEIRVLQCGCSRGQELYSLKMLIHDKPHILGDTKLHITALKPDLKLYQHTHVHTDHI